MSKDVVRSAPTKEFLTTLSTGIQEMAQRFKIQSPPKDWQDIFTRFLLTYSYYNKGEYTHPYADIVRGRGITVLKRNFIQYCNRIDRLDIARYIYDHQSQLCLIAHRALYKQEIDAVIKFAKSNHMADKVWRMADFRASSPEAATIYGNLRSVIRRVELNIRKTKPKFKLNLEQGIELLLPADFIDEFPHEGSAKYGRQTVGPRTKQKDLEKRKLD